MYISLHGRRVGFNENSLLFNGRPVGGSTPTGFGRGQTFYVDSNVAGADGASPDTALATINAAVAKCTASQGDTIVVCPKHAETITAAGGVTISKAGVSVIGLGNAAQRPTITYTTANTATVLVSAADVYIENIKFLANFATIATAIDVTATGLRVLNCSFEDTDSTHNFVLGIKASGAANTADGLRVEQCKFLPKAAASASFIKAVDNIDNVFFQDNLMISAGTTSTAFAASCFMNSSTGKLVTNAMFGWNIVINAMTAGELFFSTDGTTNSGVVHNNYLGHADVTTTHDPGYDGAGFRLFNNLSTSVDNLSGFVLPAIDVNN